jgi:hypothetical protein
MSAHSPKKEGTPFHPILVGSFPLLAFYSKNIGSTPPQQLWRPAIIVTLGVAAIWLLLNLILKSAWRSALVTTAFTLLFFSYEHAENLASRFWEDLSHGRPPARMIFLAIWAIISIAICVLLARVKKGEKAVNGFLNVVSIVLVITSGGSAYAAYSGTVEGESEIASTTTTGGPVAPIAGPNPDVFYLLMDGYGRQDTLKEYMGVDDAPFVNELRKRGFYVADKAHSNYAQTELSLPSSLNMEYVQDILKTMPPNFPRTRKALEAFVDYNTVSDEFKKRGYTYIYVSTGFPFFTGAGADVRTLGEVQGLTLYESSLVDLTPLSLVKSGFLSSADEKRKLIHSAFSTLASLGQPGPKPKFVFAHILLPHPPFVFAADGTPGKPDIDTLFDGSMYMSVGGTKDSYIVGYSNQLLYANTQLLATIDALVKNGKTPPIIIIQGDHGSRMLHDFKSLKDTDFKECMAILNAYYVPQPVRGKLYPGITPVNSFRLIFTTLYGGNFPPLPDRSYYATWDAPTDFTDVTDLARQADFGVPAPPSPNAH